MFDGCQLFKVQYFTNEKTQSNTLKHVRSDSRLIRDKNYDTHLKNKIEQKHEIGVPKLTKHQKMSIKQLKQKSCVGQNYGKNGNITWQNQQKTIDNKSININVELNNTQSFNPLNSCLATLQRKDKRQKIALKNKSHQDLRNISVSPNNYSFKQSQRTCRPSHTKQYSDIIPFQKTVQKEQNVQNSYQRKYFPKNPVHNQNISFHLINNNNSFQARTLRKQEVRMDPQTNTLLIQANNMSDLLFSFSANDTHKKQQKLLKIQKKNSQKTCSTPNLTVPSFIICKKQADKDSIKIINEGDKNTIPGQKSKQKISKLANQNLQNPETPQKREFKHQITALQFKKKDHKINEIGQLSSIQNSIPDNYNSVNSQMLKQFSVKSLQQVKMIKNSMKTINLIKNSFPDLQTYKNHKNEHNDNKQTFRPFKSKNSTQQEKSHKKLLTPPINQYPSEQSLINSITHEDVQFQINQQNGFPTKNSPLIPKLTESQVDANQNCHSGKSSVVLFGMAQETKKQTEKDKNFLHPNYQPNAKVITSIYNTVSEHEKKLLLQQEKKGWICGNKLLEQVDIHQSNYMHINPVQSLIQKKSTSPNNSPEASSSGGFNRIGRDRGYFESVVQ